MAAVCKQLEAAQGFLKQVAQLPNFGALRDKQQERFARYAAAC